MGRRTLTITTAASLTFSLSLSIMLSQWNEDFLPWSVSGQRTVIFITRVSALVVFVFVTLWLLSSGRVNWAIAKVNKDIALYVYTEGPPHLKGVRKI